MRTRQDHTATPDDGADSTDGVDPIDDAHEPTTPLADLPPSAKLVAKTLRYEGELTQATLVEETRLPRRTVRHALNRLEDAGHVDERISFVDARQRIYTLVEGSKA